MFAYFRSLSEATTRCWDRFWFSWTDPAPLGLIRMLTGLMLLAFFLSITPEQLVELYGPFGYLPIETTDVLTGERGIPQASYLAYLQSDSELFALHGVAVLVAGFITLGIFSRMACAFGLFILSSYLWRAPLVGTEVMPILAFLLLYCVLGPSGQAFGLDGWWQRRKHAQRRLRISWTANLALRLMQVHLAIVWLMMGTEKASSQTGAWSSGMALWWLLARTETHAIDWTWLAPFASGLFILGAMIPWLQIAYAIFIWNPLLRPLMLGLSIPVWLLLGLASGQWLLAATMLVGNVAFLDGTTVRRLCGISTDKTEANWCTACCPPLDESLPTPRSRDQVVAPPSQTVQA